VVGACGVVWYVCHIILVRVPPLLVVWTKLKHTHAHASAENKM